ncbi:MAG: hypothetical protein ACK4UK_03970, partial [Flavobacterium sp.]
MQGSKTYIALTMLVLLTIGCGSTYKFKPPKDKYQYFFGIKLPVLSDNEKQFVVTNKMKKAIKNAKDFNCKRDELYDSLKKKYLHFNFVKFFWAFGRLCRCVRVINAAAREV